jgi:hypothetical protein
MVLNATFNNISVISHGGQFYWWGKPEYPEKTITYRHLQTLSHNVVSSTPLLSGVRTHNVSGDRH